MNRGNSMKAVAYDKLLPSSDENALLDIELEQPVASGLDCLVEVKAIAVNPVDTKIRTSVQPAEGQYGILGWDACGVITEVGDQVSLFKPGDEVWYAGAVNRPGCNAEYQLVDERLIGLKPGSLSFSDAAALPLTSLTAWEILFDRLQIQLEPAADLRLLITGGAGGVGSIMIQLARTLTSATVITTASRPETIEWVKSLGADLVLNHRSALADELAQQGLDYVTHVASLNQTDQHFSELVKMLKPQGKLALIDSPGKPLDIVSMKQKSLSLHWEFMYTRSLFETEDMIKQHQILSRLSSLVEQGRVKSTQKQHFGTISAENILRAHRLLETNASIGKIVLEGF
jgi:zinc-binding alcohol dehydrogenase family protein